MFARRMLVSVLAVTLLLIPSAGVGATETRDFGVNVLSTDGFVIAAGSVVVVGEVRNDTDFPVGNVKIRVRYLAGDGTKILEQTVMALLDTLDPGEVSPFHADAKIPQTAQRFAAAVIDYDYPSMPANHYFTLSMPTNGNVDATTYGVVGTARNDNTTQADGIRVVATLYEANGDVIGADEALVDAASVAAGDVATFLVLVDHVGEVGRVTAVAESMSTPALPTTLDLAPFELPWGGPVVATGKSTAGASVTIERYEYSLASWVPTAGPVTATADGSFSATFKAGPTGSFRASIEGGRSSLALLIVDAAVTLKTSTKTARLGTKVTLSGTAAPAYPGAKVLIQRKTGATWKTVLTAPVKSGKFTASWTPKAKGTWVLRAHLPAQSVQSIVFDGDSKTLTITVK